MRKRIFYLSFLSLTSVLLIGVMVQYARALHERRNGFSRFFFASTILHIHTLDLNHNSYYIAGISNQSIYLGNYQASLRLLRADFLLNDTQVILIRKPRLTLDHWPNSRLFVDSPEMYLMEGITPCLLNGSLSNRGFEGKSVKDTIPFTESIPLSNHSYVLRTYDALRKQNTLTRTSLNFPYFKRLERALIKQVDGFFCTDGQLLYDKNLHRIIYLYYYRNQFICLDSLLTNEEKYKTIDTNSLAKITVDSIQSQKINTLSTPALPINKQGWAFHQHLFIWSGLRADNEDQQQFERSAVIDGYSLVTGRYEGSFYIPDFRGLKAKSYAFGKNTAVVLYGNFLVTYEIKNALFSE